LVEILRELPRIVRVDRLFGNPFSELKSFEFLATVKGQTRSSDKV
jgi:hypothetical protein